MNFVPKLVPKSLCERESWAKMGTVAQISMHIISDTLNRKLKLPRDCFSPPTTEHHNIISTKRERKRYIFRMHISSSHSSGKKWKWEKGRNQHNDLSNKVDKWVWDGSTKSLMPHASSPKKPCKEQNNQNMQIYSRACKQKNKSSRIMGQRQK